MEYHPPASVTAPGGVAKTRPPGLPAKDSVADNKKSRPGNSRWARDNRACKGWGRESRENPCKRGWAVAAGSHVNVLRRLCRTPDRCIPRVRLT